MNKPFQYLIAGSAAALLCAIAGAMWLVWHSLEESRALERKNRELQASLEASRIRVENFCEYPADVLCKVDPRTGSMAEMMDISGFEASPLAGAQPDGKDASLAVKHQKAVAAVQSLLAAAAETPKAAPSAEIGMKTQDAGKMDAKTQENAKAAAPAAVKKAGSPAPNSGKNAVQDAKKPSAKAEAPVTPSAAVKNEAPAPKKEPLAKPQPSAKSEKTVPAPATEKTASAASSKAVKAAQPTEPVKSVSASAPDKSASAPEPAKAAKAPAPSAPVVKAEVPAAPAVPVTSNPEPVSNKADAATPEPSGRLEISGKLILLPEEPDSNAPAKPAAPAASKGKMTAPKTGQSAVPKAEQGNAAKAAPPAAGSAVNPTAQPSASTKKAVGTEVRKTWSSIEHDGANFGFTITGAGDALPASGQLLAQPWRYELTLPGSWAVQSHSNAENRLVKNMRLARRGNDTVIIFNLKQKPYRCSLHRPDKRTVTVRIR